MVAYANNCNTSTLWAFDYSFKWFRNSSFYLYPILKNAGNVRMKNDISSEKALETTGILALVCLIIGIAFQKMILMYSAVLLLFTGLFFKKISLKIAWSWLKIAELIGTLNTKLILTFIFFAILTPVAFLYRFFYGDFMCLKRRSLNDKSYWKIREHTLKTDTFEKMW